MKQLQKKLAPLTETENLVFRALFDEGETYTNLQTNTVFYKTFDEVGFSLESKLKNVINDASSRIIRNFCIAWSVVSLALCLLSYFAIADLEPRLSYLYNLSFYAEGLTVFLTVIMGRKTPYGEKVTSQVKGFREYLRLVETEQLKAMVNQNPNYFYDIIPYAYVLNLSKEWIKKFEDIPIPDNYMGNYDYRDLTMYDDLYDSVYYPTSTGSGSGGCSSCGGGCSSCGGGCSSCGGGGSW